MSFHKTVHKDTKHDQPTHYKEKIFQWFVQVAELISISTQLQMRHF